MKRLVLASLILALLLAAPVFAQTKVSNYLQDNADLFTSEQSSLVEQSLRDFEDKTSVQFVIFTTDKIPDDTTLEEYSLKIAEDNKIGREGLDTGLLFFIAVDDRKYRWEVGYGLEDTLNTAWLGRNSRDNMVPYFKEGKYAEGILAGMKVVMQKILNTEDEDILPAAINVNTSEYREVTMIIIILLALFIFGITVAIILASKGGGMLPTSAYRGAATGIFRSGGGGFGGMGGGFGGGGFSGGW